MGLIHIDTCPICGNKNLLSFLQVRDQSISGESFSLVQCPACTLVLTQDHPDGSAIGKYYDSDSYISHSDTQRGLINRLYHHVRSFMLDKKKAWVDRHCHNVPGKLIDIGCGTGYFAHHMQSAGWEVKGLEPDPSARNLAKEKFNLDVEDTACLFDLDSQYDVITLWHVLEHVHRMNAYLQKFRSLLNERGILLIAVPNYTSRDARHYKEDWAAWDVPRHLWHFSPAAMHHLMTKHGFQITRKYGMVFDPFYVSMLSEKYREAGLGVVSGGINGLLSNLAAWRDTDRSSSLVYICKIKT